MPTAVTYSRRSKLEQKKQTVESTEAQTAENLHWAAEHHVEVIGTFSDNLWMTSHETSTFLRPAEIEARRLHLPIAKEEAA